MPQQCRMFLWLVSWDKLLTNANREKRGLTNNLICPLCEMEYETTDHVLRSCPEAATVWQWFHSTGMGKFDSQLPFNEWAKLNILGKDLMKVVTTMWYIWKWRTLVCFNGVDTIPNDKPKFLLGQFHEILDALAMEDLRGGKKRKVPSVCGLGTPRRRMDSVEY